MFPLINTRSNEKVTGSARLCAPSAGVNFLVDAQLPPGRSQIIRSRVADPATAEDILHDVFVKFHSRLDEFGDPAKVQGWLFLVARNSIIDHYRTRKPTIELSDSLPAEMPRIQVTEMEELHVVFRRIIALS